ncbi:lipopolysaccharide-induced tumor necrosis factor-alpha factor homolog [Protopterus annectens]|uniref:lipopolysaccharide-induced tumor necrosis factor-alpha factor homolog n=1 Tax=Protopterus annectens TaxID=7888 RepID=UPI001CF9ED53|nr:lipopolysaccharide-induced tumor necrosis factor-alpha factor homolog [Protopterus annectens]XP_043919252.1 lipopolysaccharide-induced tumor necrosis factor-alpha factor homolog [Protopterus annectens]
MDPLPPYSPPPAYSTHVSVPDHGHNPYFIPVPDYIVSSGYPSFQTPAVSPAASNNPQALEFPMSYDCPVYPGNEQKVAHLSNSGHTFNPHIPPNNEHRNLVGTAYPAGHSDLQQYSNNSINRGYIPNSGYGPNVQDQATGLTNAVAVIVQPVVIAPPPVFGREAVYMTCPFCRSYVITQLYSKPGKRAWTVCCILGFLGLDLGCCLIPFCIESWKDVTHICPVCRNILGKYRPH